MSACFDRLKMQYTSLLEHQNEHSLNFLRTFICLLPICSRERETNRERKRERGREHLLFPSRKKSVLQ